jgi:hypothetical protein
LAGHIWLEAAFDITGSAPARLATLAVLVAVGLFIYAAALQLLGVTSLARIVGSVRRRL